MENYTAIPNEVIEDYRTAQLFNRINGNNRKVNRRAERRTHRLNKTIAQCLIRCAVSGVLTAVGAVAGWVTMICIGISVAQIAVQMRA